MILIKNINTVYNENVKPSGYARLDAKVKMRFYESLKAYTAYRAR